MFPAELKTLELCKQITDHLAERPEALENIVNAVTLGARVAVAAAGKREGAYRTALTCALALLNGDRVKGPTGDAMARLILGALNIEGVSWCETDRKAAAKLKKMLGGRRMTGIDTQKLRLEAETRKNLFDSFTILAPLNRLDELEESLRTSLSLWAESQAQAAVMREALEMVRDADDDCLKDDLLPMPPPARHKIDNALSTDAGQKGRAVFAAARTLRDCTEGAERGWHWVQLDKAINDFDGRK